MIEQTARPTVEDVASEAPQPVAAWIKPEVTRLDLETAQQTG